MHADERFPRQVRLLQSADYQAVFKSADCKSSDKYFTILARTNQSPYPRLGMAITKKKIKRAVDRHGLKRLIRESFRRHKVEMSGLDIIVMGTTATIHADNSQLFSLLDEIWD